MVSGIHIREHIEQSIDYGEIDFVYIFIILSDIRFVRYVHLTPCVIPVSDMVLNNLLEGM